MARDKRNLNVAFVGHVDHGKSTTIGRLMFDLGHVSQQELDKLRAEAEKHGKLGFEFAFVMDKFKEERERGVTIDLSYKKLNTQKYQITIIDAPGHKDFIKNMITGASQADAAFLTVSALEGVQPQTKEHLWLLRTMGVRQIAILINKMDRVGYKEDAFNKTKAEVSALLKQVGINPEKTTFIAGSGLKGDNIAKKSENMPWYKGPTVLEQFDKFEEPAALAQYPLRMPIQDAYEITGIGTVPVGKIIRGVGKKDVARGDVICDAAKPAPVVKEFTAMITVINHQTVIAKGYTPVFHVHTGQVPCQFTELLEKREGDQVIKNPDFLKNGDIAKVRITPMGNLVLEKQSDNPMMSGFAIRDAGATVAAGVCVELVAK